MMREFLRHIRYSKKMIPLYKNIRFYVLIASVTCSIVIYAYIQATIPEGSFRTIRLSQIYGLTAIALLYFTLLAGPFCFAFRHLPHRGWYLRSRRALGVSTFYFGCLHTYQAFFHQLGGFAGLGFLPPRYLLAVGLSFTALLMLALLASTSFEVMIKWLTYRRWKLLHRLAYVIGVLILVHALLLGTHFANLRGLVPQLYFFGLAFLLILQARRVDFHLQRRFAGRVPRQLVLVGVIGLLVAYLAYIWLGDPTALGVHSTNT